MTNIVECVLFELEDNTDVDEFLLAAEASNAFVKSQPGFVSRRLSCSSEGQWIEHIEWQNMEYAKSAAQRIGSDPSVAGFVSCIKSASINMFHATLKITLN